MSGKRINFVTLTAIVLIGIVCVVGCTVDVTRTATTHCRLQCASCVAAGVHVCHKSEWFIDGEVDLSLGYAAERPERNGNH